jgi:hypothetical protein
MMTPTPETIIIGLVIGIILFIVIVYREWTDKK